MDDDEELLTDEERDFLRELYAVTGDNYLPRMLQNINELAHEAMEQVDDEFSKYAVDHIIEIAKRILEENPPRNPEKIPEFELGIILGTRAARALYFNIIDETHPLDLDLDSYADELKAMIAEGGTVH